ncbi:MAG: peptidase M64 [Acidobacteria bacterium]|nr:peptidase M64 [Acidobacteriota bacterium]
MRIRKLSWVAMAVAVSVAVCAPAAVPERFAADFIDRTMRVDFLHVGNAKTETIVLDRVVEEGRWPGSRTHLVDPTHLGVYKAEVFASRGNRLLWSYGFNSYFGEYTTTKAARAGVVRAFEQTIRFPWPKKAVRLVLLKRSRKGVYARVFETAIDPDDPAIVRQRPARDVLVVRPKHVREIHHAVDIAILGEGYTRGQVRLFRKDLAHFTKVFFSREPYRSFRSRINVWGVLPVSEDSGCDEPGRGVWRRTALDASFDSLGSPRYLLTRNDRAVRDAAAHVPYDAIVIMVNNSRYGGGGIYNLYCIFTAHNRWSDFLFLHEFGHSFTGLADEYFDDSTVFKDFYAKGVEPPEPNITALLDPAHLKWAALVSPGTPIPTPWSKAAYDTMNAAYQERRQQLNREIAGAMRHGAPATEVARLKAEAAKLAVVHGAKVHALFAASPYAGKVGAFEGAGYVSHGMYRPMLDCIMFSRGDKPYCLVCQRAIRQMLEWRGE